jgi:HNH endonuclease
VSNHRAKKERWVRDAVAITDALTRDGDGRYLCPLCLGWYTDLDDLSLEHAPPESVGGRHIAVTCRDCNSRGGYTVDAELRRAQTVVEFAAREMTRPMLATVQIDGIEQRVEATFRSEGLSIAGVPQQNHPAAAAAVMAALRERATSGSTDWSITLSFRSPDLRKAAIGWLRSGYLVAFATLGYLYILREELDQVRRQIQDPSAEILQRHCLLIRPSRLDRRVTFVKEPHELASVAVFADRFAVLLPSDVSPGTYERLADVETWPPGEQTLSGSSAPWPTKPVYALDRTVIDRMTQHSLE